jgi:hypothetical protein
MPSQPVGRAERSASVEDRIAALRRRPPEGSGSAAVGVYARVSDNLHAMYWIVPAHRLYPLVVAAMRMNRGVRSPAQHGGVASPAAGLAMLAGRIAYLDFDLVDVADGHQLEAIGLAYQARDPQAAAAAMAHRAHIESRSGSHDRARVLIDEANSVLTRVGTAGRTHLQRVWQDTVAAEVAVRGGDGDRGISALRIMNRRMGGMRSADAPSWLDFFDRSRLSGAVGAAELRMGQPERAALMLRDSLRTSSPQAAKELSVVLADLADARRMQSDFAEACELLTRAMDVLDAHDYLIGLRRVVEVRQALPPTVATAELSLLDRRLSTWDTVLRENGRSGAGGDPTARGVLGG